MGGDGGLAHASTHWLVLHVHQLGRRHLPHPLIVDGDLAADKVPRTLHGASTAAQTVSRVLCSMQWVFLHTLRRSKLLQLCNNNYTEHNEAQGTTGSRLG